MLSGDMSSDDILEQRDAGVKRKIGGWDRDSVVEGFMAKAMSYLGARCG